jgi:hypothetical protein
MHTKRHENGTLLYMEGGAAGADVDNDKVSQAIDHVFVHDVHELVFAQPDTDSSSMGLRSSCSSPFQTHRY